jgi:hypothetical protein
MNERIRELAEQAGLKTELWYNPKPFVIYKEDANNPDGLKKFAELIVRECMNAVCDPRTTYLESMTESSAMYTARERIRKHFGVKE